jgi:hypothetical protein
MNGSRSLSHIPTLDERWLEFVARTQGVFSAHPDLVPVRQQIFKSFVERRQSLSWNEYLKHLAKLALKRQRTQIDQSSVDIVFWLDSLSDVRVQALLPVLTEAQNNGLRTALIVPSALCNHLDAALNPIAFQFPYRRRPRSRRAWDNLRQALPDDVSPDSFSAFCATVETSSSCVEEIRRIFSHLHPRMLVLAMDQLLSGSAACEAARQMGIPSLVLMHGAVLPYNTPISADTMGVWGTVAQEQLTALSVPVEKLAILGSPRHDLFSDHAALDARHRFQQTLGLRDLPHLVFFSNGNDPLRNSQAAVEGCAEWLAAAAERLRDRIEIVVRLHPNEDGSLYTKYPHLRVFKNECDLATTIGAADMCAALCSTALLDAMLYHKPVLQFYADGWPDLADNWRRGLSERVADKQQLVDILVTGLDNRCWQAYTERQNTHIDEVFANRGHAAKVIAQYLNEKVREHI